MRISDWSSDVCSSDLPLLCRERWAGQLFLNCVKQIYISTCGRGLEPVDHVQIWLPFELPKENFGQLLESVSNYGKQFGITPFETCIVVKFVRSEEHTSELQSLMRISYAVFCLKKKNKHNHNTSCNYHCILQLS